MGRFEDQRLVEIHLYRHVAGVPAEDCAIIWRKLELLLATPQWTGIELVGDAFALSTGRIAIMVTPDWGISFEWWEGDGAFAMRLEP